MSAATMLPVVWGEGARKAAVAGVAVQRQTSAVAGRTAGRRACFLSQAHAVDVAAFYAHVYANGQDTVRAGRTGISRTSVELQASKF